MSDTAQAKIFFGREVDMDIAVVLKQYQGDTFSEIIREIKLFTLLEKEKMQAMARKEQEIEKFIIKETEHDALP